MRTAVATSCRFGMQVLNTRAGRALDDIGLVEKALAGSQEAYRLLVERYQRPVYGILVRMVRNAPIAEELAQDSFVKAFSKLESFDKRRKFASWLFKIAHNTAIDHLRKKELDTVSLETPDDTSVDPIAVVADQREAGPEDRALHGDLARALEEAIANLRPEYREAVLLRYQAGLPYEEIADITGLALGTVKTHLFRARKSLARLMAARGWGPDGERGAK